MKIKGFSLILLLMVALTFAGFAGGQSEAEPEQEAKVIKITMSIADGPQDVVSLAALKWAEDLTQRSKGQMQMDVVTGGVLGSPKEVIDAMSINDIQGQMGGPTFLHSHLREYQIMEAEYVYEDEAHGRRVWDGALGDKVKAALEEKYNVKLLGVASRGARNVTSNKPILKPEDMAGVKIRVTNPLRQEVFKSFGALPAPLSISEVYGALKTGVFDAQENPVVTIYGNKYYEVQKYINLTGHVWSYYTALISNDFYNSLTPGQQEMLVASWEVARDWLDAEVARITTELLDKMQKEYDITVTEPDVKAFMDKARPIVSAYAEENCVPGLLDEIATYAR
jgi:tripartite ATP-independent transporter DctP family solute receptor